MQTIRQRSALPMASGRTWFFRLANMGHQLHSNGWRTSRTKRVFLYLKAALVTHPVLMNPNTMQIDTSEIGLERHSPKSPKGRGFLPKTDPHQEQLCCRGMRPHRDQLGHRGTLLLPSRVSLHFHHRSHTPAMDGQGKRHQCQGNSMVSLVAGFHVPGPALSREQARKCEWPLKVP